MKSIIFTPDAIGFKKGTGKRAKLKNKFANFQKPPEEFRKKLTPPQYEVTQKNGTEMPFHNEYWSNQKEGIYVDIISSEHIFKLSQ